MFSWEWRCSWSSTDRRCSNYIVVINKFIVNQGGSFIRGFKVFYVHTKIQPLKKLQCAFTAAFYSQIVIYWSSVAESFSNRKTQFVIEIFCELMLVSYRVLFTHKRATFSIQHFWAEIHSWIDKILIYYVAIVCLHHLNWIEFFLPVWHIECSLKAFTNTFGSMLYQPPVPLIKQTGCMNVLRRNGGV